MPKPDELPSSVIVCGDVDHPQFHLPKFPTKFHRSTCSHAESPYAQKVQLESALSNGWTPCTQCLAGAVVDEVAAAGDALERGARKLLKTPTKKLLSKLPPRTVKPPWRRFTSWQPVRDRRVVALVLRRAKGRCEMPECGYTPFLTARGDPYLEVHHITQLRDGGSDHPSNAAALCPICHRRLHFGARRANERKALRVAVKARQAELEA
jgi:5-methylcytosine-specific restriction endonuclease McrA